MGISGGVFYSPGNLLPLLSSSDCITVIMEFSDHNTICTTAPAPH